jgi:DNA primase|tara:strand:+ start:4717 stop:6411 length:1695 start_codon:yes stop_codon:yes gene_type:complete
MASLDRAFIDDLLSRIDIVDVIGHSVQLKKHGTGYKGLCPFHAENTPSFNVSGTKQFYHCFGCGASGDAIKFLREHDGLTFMEAIEKLAAIANVEIPKSYSKKNDSSKKLFQINDIINKHYIQNLKSNNFAAKYLEQRGITGDLINKFHIGVANDSWESATNILKGSNQIKDGLKIGLLVESKGKVYDRFRNRIMFPIRSTSGNIIAFGGRTLNKDDNAKYINSPESDLFYKSAELYGLYESKQDINKKDQIIIVEGYTDVVALHKNGFGNSVAALGTAFTKLHLTKLLRYSKNIVFCFDGDVAGKKAAWKAMTNCLTEIRDDTNVSFSFIQDGKDPDELSNQDPNAFKDVINNSLPLSDFLFNSLLQNLDLNKIEDKTKFTRTILPLIQLIPMGIYRKLLEEKLSSLTNLSKEDLFKGTQENVNAKDIVRTDPNINITDGLLLSIFLEHPDLLEEFIKEVLNIVKNENIIKMLKLIPKFKNGNSFQMNKFLEADDEIKNIFLIQSSKKVVYKDKASAKNTILSVLKNYKDQNRETEYFAILQKYSDGEKLTDQEKEILKNFKK